MQTTRKRNTGLALFEPPAFHLQHVKEADVAHIQLRAHERNVGILVRVTWRVFVGNHMPVVAVKHCSRNDEGIGAGNTEFFLRGLKFGHDIAHPFLDSSVIFHVKLDMALAPFRQSYCQIEVFDFILDRAR